MNQTQRLRPGQPNPLRYQGGLRHYHVAPIKKKVPWDELPGSRRSIAARIWQQLLNTIVVLVILAAVAGGAWMLVAG